MTKITVSLLGPDWYCPFCGRQLVHINDDGSMNLADKASAELSGALPVSPDTDGEADAYVVEAHCFRRLCRLRRRLHLTKR